MMIETRPLNRIETNLLIAEADDSETKNLLRFLSSKNKFAHDFLNDWKMVYKYGLLIDRRPIYLAHICDNNGRYELWTVVTKNVKEQKTLYKYSKLALQEALKKFSPIYATMEKNLHKNLFWTEHLGFKRVSEDERIVTLKIGE